MKCAGWQEQQRFPMASNFALQALKEFDKCFSGLTPEGQAEALSMHSEGSYRIGGEV
jgi:hypothetical protein